MRRPASTPEQHIPMWIAAHALADYGKGGLVNLVV
jgi:hypothetical protein